MNSLTLKAPAKVNLFLKVLGKRRDGYHDLHTLFERLDLADTITLTRIPAGIIVTSNRPITAEARDNLVYKAAQAVLREGGAAGGVRIHIRKRIPIAAGLGGGSSDAAATLVGVNKLYALGLSRAALLHIGSLLGADISFFILNTALAEGKGKGNVLKKVVCRRKLWHLLVNPGFGVATRGVYEAFDRRNAAVSKCLTSARPNAKIHRLLGGRAPFGLFETMMHNDLEAVVASQEKVIGKLIERLALATGRRTILSGSGPSVFCLCETRKEAMRAKRRFMSAVPAAARKGWQVLVTGTLM